MPLFRLREQQRLWTGGSEQTGLWLGGAKVWPVEAATGGRVNMDVKTLGLAVPRNELDIGSTAWLDDFQAMGVPLIRFDFYFDQIQETAGGPYDWSDEDALVDAALARGIQVLPILNGSPPGTAFDETYASSANRQAYADFCAAASAHFAGRCDTWAIYNEPNLNKMTPENYSLLISLAAPAIRAANPNAFIVGPNLASIPPPTSGMYFSNADWMSQMYAAGGNVYYDALGFHPYTYPGWPSDEQAYGGLRQLLDVVRPAMVAAGEGHKKVWITEYGYPSSGSGTGSEWYSPVYQEEVLQEFIDYIDPLEWVGPAFWYTYQDRGGATGDMENWFGVKDPTGVAKPSYASIITLMAAYPKFEHTGGGPIEEPDPSIDDIPGLVWATATPIVSTATGDVTPPIPISITTGAVYVAISFTPERQTSSARRAFFSLNTSDQWGNEFAGMSMFTEWGEARIGDSGVYGDVVMTSDPSGRQTWETWREAGSVGLVTQDYGSDMQTGPGALPEIINLRLAHNSDWGSIGGRRDQTTYRMRVYDRIPTEEERARIRGWVTDPIGEFWGTGDGEIPLHFRPEDAVMDASGENVLSVPNRGGMGAALNGTKMVSSGVINKLDGLFYIPAYGPYLQFPNTLDVATGIRIFMVLNIDPALPHEARIFGSSNTHARIRTTGLAILSKSGTGSYTTSPFGVSGAYPHGELRLYEFEINAGIDVEFFVNGNLNGRLGSFNQEGFDVSRVFGGNSHAMAGYAGDVVFLNTGPHPASPQIEQRITTVRNHLMSKYGITAE